eukprot:CAMPEP_0178962246 /NCGR_PEP_ID=MMETSP0789-20121207/14238_1 /TAXON_ID=3005 /ORGANISM="Rhizosolenia setigera, Strain CCMP 1694" /LENGTH=299 /DNA_ID=CAMNT_0020646335 /DNA_START=35 /DNA_END=934 /DNA_ORIENTATION=-
MSTRISPPISFSVLVAALLSVLSRECHSFSISPAKVSYYTALSPLTVSYHRSILHGRYSTTQLYTSSSDGSKSNDSFSDGQKLAQEFANELKKRQILEQEKEGNDDGIVDGFNNDSIKKNEDQDRSDAGKKRKLQDLRPISSSSSQEEEPRNDRSSGREEEFRFKAFEYRKEVRAGKDVVSPTRRSAGLFSDTRGQQNNQLYSFPNTDNNNNRSPNNSGGMNIGDEFSNNSLLNFFGSEASLVVQGVLVLSLLCFAIYIGYTGGITDGSERDFFGADDIYEIFYDDDNQVPTEDSSVWL